MVLLNGGIIENISMNFPEIGATTSGLGSVTQSFREGVTTIKNVGVTGTIIGDDSVGSLIGGVGNYNGATVLIENCYSKANVIARCGNGGLARTCGTSNKVTANKCYYSGTFVDTDSYKDGGTFCKPNDAKISISTNCYYNTNKFEETSNRQGTALTTVQFVDKNNFCGWDSENTWIMKDG